MSEYQSVDRTGNFRGRILEYEGREGKQGGMSIWLKVLITGWWDSDNECWDDDWEQYSMVVEGYICVVKNDKQIHEPGSRSLISYAGWDGSMLSIANRTWEPPLIGLTVEENEYKGNVSMRIGFINPFDFVPGSFGIDEDGAKRFDAKYGAKLRAMTGNTARNSSSTVPQGKPVAQKPQNRPSPPKEDDSDIPF